MFDVGILVGVFCLLILLLIVFEIFLLWFWISTLMECVREETFDENKRIVWIIVIATTGAIGALIYVLARRPERLKEEAQKDFEKVYVKEEPPGPDRMYQTEQERAWRYYDGGYPVCPQCGIPLRFPDVPNICPYCGTWLYR